MTWRAAFRRKLRRPWVLEGVSLNDDFSDRRSDVRPTLRARRPAWIGVQEGKRHDYADELPERYGVTQRMRNDATAGVAIIYDRKQVSVLGANRDNPRRLGEGYQQLIPAGHGLLARGVAWRDVRVGRRGSRRQVRLATWHRPPPRTPARVVREFDRALNAWLARSPIPVWGTHDANEKNPRRLAFRGRKRLSHVDGHVITKGLRFRSAVRPLKRRTSDHRAVAALVRVPRRRK